MEKKRMVVTTNKWHKPQISIIVDDEQISFCIELKDFIQALKIELQLNNEDSEQLDKGFKKAMDKVIQWSGMRAKKKGPKWDPTIGGVAPLRGPMPS
jgi:hypothetical protein